MLKLEESENLTWSANSNPRVSCSVLSVSLRCSVLIVIAFSVK